MHHEKIAAWAARVQPGSPAPLSPVPFSPLSLSPPTTPKLVDLTALGYTTVFVHFPHSRKDLEIMPPPQQQQRSTPSAFSRLCSLANFRTRSRSKSVTTLAGAGANINSAPSASKPKHKPTTTTTPKSKRSKYAHVLPPPPLANDLALMQFADGGSIESHAKRVMKAQARAAAGSHYNSHDATTTTTNATTTCLSVVYKDGQGNMWWDEDEEYEYAHLLDGENDDMYAAYSPGNEGPDAWVRFGSQSSSSSPSGKDSPRRHHHHQRGVTELRTELERRESLWTQESDLMDTRSLVKPAEEGTMPLVVPGLSVLSIPARLKKPALRKPEFLVDVAAFVPRSPTASSSRPRGKARRRPAPLQIPPLSTSTLKRPSNPALPTAALHSAEKTRREFIENSFEPVLLSQPTQKPVTPNDAKTTAASPAKTLGLDLRSMFAAGIRNE